MARARLSDPAIRIVDIRGIGHIPGAVFVDWLEDIVQTDAPVPMTVAFDRSNV